METKTVIVTLDPEVEALLSDNSVNLITQLKKQGLEVKRGKGSKVLPAAENGTKSVELIILASAVAAPLVATGISKVIDALGRHAQISKIGSAEAGPASAPKGYDSEHSMVGSFLGLKVKLTDKYKSPK
jgi:hypothetical protein